MNVNERRTGVAPSNRLKLFRAFVENPKQVASVIPSSRALQRELSGLSCLRNAGSVVELGPGTGETTEAILTAVSASARVLCIEIVPGFVEAMRCIEDPRLTVEMGNAVDVQTILSRRRFPDPDVIVSGIPFSHLSPDDGRRLVDAIHDVLVPGGAFVAYQFRDRIREFAQRRFGTPEVSFVPWNIPPLDVYVWKKKTVAMEATGRQ
jgi:phosphatidylethanolamine/phosphatidyl-N-methylethanolamine N-methyltransferase